MTVHLFILYSFILQTFIVQKLHAKRYAIHPMWNELLRDGNLRMSVILNLKNNIKID